MIHVNGKDYLFAKCTGYVTSSFVTAATLLKEIVASSSGSDDGPTFLAFTYCILVRRLWSLIILHIASSSYTHSHHIISASPCNIRPYC